jgi:hypothetical protein
MFVQFLYVNCVFADDGATLYQEQLLHAHRSPFLANHHWQTLPDPKFGTLNSDIYSLPYTLTRTPTRRPHALPVLELAESCAETHLVRPNLCSSCKSHCSGAAT